MHILLIHQAFAALHEPGGTRHHELARFLVSRGHQVTVIASPVSYLTGQEDTAPLIDAQPENAMEGITILRAPTYSALHKSFYHRLMAFFSFMFSSFRVGLQVKNVDLVWGTSPPIFQGLSAWALARIKGAKFLFEVRDLWPDFAIAIGVLKNPLLIRLSFMLERFLYASADHMIVNSPAYVEHVRNRGARKVELIPNGADPDMFNPLDIGRKFRQDYNLKNKFAVIYAGAHGISNDLDIVLDAAKIIQNQEDAWKAPGNHTIQFILIGDGKEKGNLRNRAKELRLKNILFLPPVPKSQMADVLAGADACLAILKPLDEYKTTYPNKVFDYMAAGRAVILAIDGVIRDVVEKAGCGIFAHPGDANALADAILTMEENRDRSMKMGLAGRAYLEENFSRARLAGQLEELLKQMTAKPGKK